MPTTKCGFESREQPVSRQRKMTNDKAQMTNERRSPNDQVTTGWPFVIEKFGHFLVIEFVMSQDVTICDLFKTSTASHQT